VKRKEDEIDIKIKKVEQIVPAREGVVSEYDVRRIIEQHNLHPIGIAPRGTRITLTNGLVVESIALTAADNHGAFYVLIKRSLLAKGAVRRAIVELYKVACTSRPCKVYLYDLLVNG
jgi:hypothetical protein